MEPPDTCPNCGADVPPNSRACPACGSDESTGWSEQAKYDALDLPDDAFNYDAFVQREFGSQNRRPAGRRLFWWVAALLVLALFIILVAL